jgi:hypothetical protein
MSSGLVNPHSPGPAFKAKPTPVKTVAVDEALCPPGFDGVSRKLTKHFLLVESLNPEALLGPLGPSAVFGAVLPPSLLWVVSPDGGVGGSPPASLPPGAGAQPGCFPPKRSDKKE